MIVVGTVIVGLLMERVAYRPIRGAPDVAMLLTSFAVGQILQNGTLLTTRLAGKPTLIAFPSPDLLNGVVTLGVDHDPEGQHRELRRRASCCSGLLTVFVTRTTLGLSMRAAAEDLPAARLMGIKVNRVVATAFAIGAGLAAVAGLLYSVQAGQINPYMGFTPVLKAFIAAVIGGFGSIAGAVLGGYVLGFLEVLVTSLAGIGDLLPAGSVPPEVRAFLQQWLPERARELARRGRVRRADPGPARPPAGHPRAARPRGRAVSDRAGARPARGLVIAARGRRRWPSSTPAARRSGRASSINLAIFMILTVSPEPDERLHRRLLARPDRVHGARRLRLGDPHAAAAREGVVSARTCPPGSRASTSTSGSAPSRSGSWRRR